jgi:hypothetical protein
MFKKALTRVARGVSGLARSSEVRNASLANRSSKRPPLARRSYSAEELNRGNGSRLSLRGSWNLERGRRESGRVRGRLAEEASRRSQAVDSCSCASTTRRRFSYLIDRVLSKRARRPRNARAPLNSNSSTLTANSQIAAEKATVDARRPCARQTCNFVKPSALHYSEPTPLWTKNRRRARGISGDSLKSAKTGD